MSWPNVIDGAAVLSLEQSSATRLLLPEIVLVTAYANTTVLSVYNYPALPVQMIIPFSAGGPTDIVGRVMGAKMGELLGKQFVVENKTGAGGNIGAEAVATAAPRRLHDLNG